VAEQVHAVVELAEAQEAQRPALQIVRVYVRLQLGPCRNEARVRGESDSTQACVRSHFEALVALNEAPSQVGPEKRPSLESHVRDENCAQKSERTGALVEHSLEVVPGQHDAWRIREVSLHRLKQIHGFDKLLIHGQPFQVFEYVFCRIQFLRHLLKIIAKEVTTRSLLKQR
jgi:hypothetical protein